MKKNSVYLFIILFLIVVLVVVYYYGFVNNEDKDNQINNVSVENKSEGIEDTNTEFKPAIYVIQFDEDLLGEEFKSAGGEIKDCKYEITFSADGKFNINTGFGNSVQGTYSVDRDIIDCTLTALNGENSSMQSIDGEISFKINNDSELEITDASESYTIKIVDTAGEESKEMLLWPLVKGIKYTIEK